MNTHSELATGVTSVDSDWVDSTTSLTDERITAMLPLPAAAAAAGGGGAAVSGRRACRSRSSTDAASSCLPRLHRQSSTAVLR